MRLSTIEFIARIVKPPHPAPALWLSLCLALPAGSRAADSDSREIARSALAQVESAAGKSNSLRLLGKRTLAQGAVILDLGAESLPVLLEALTDRGRDWKVRYWAADMLGYVGDGQTAYVLMEVARDGKENGPVRVRAVESVAEIASRGGMEPERAREGLMRVARAANRELADKVSAAVKRLERLKPASSRAKPGPSR